MTTVEEYTQRKVEEEGVFRVFPVAWTIEESTKAESKSVAIAFQLAILQKCDDAADGIHATS